MKLGIVGLPNVGKSTLFNSLTKAGAESANYPFCTIDTNLGVVAVPDERLQKLGEMYQSKKVTPAVIEFVAVSYTHLDVYKRQFENADMSDAVMHKAKSYVDNWEEMKRNHIGCLLWGPVGTGKSYICLLYTSRCG